MIFFFFVVRPLDLDPNVFNEGCCGTELLQGAVELGTQGNRRRPDLLPCSLVGPAILEDVPSRHQGFLTWTESSGPYFEFRV